MLGCYCHFVTFDPFREPSPARHNIHNRRRRVGRMLAGSREMHQLIDRHHSSSAARPLGGFSISASPVSPTVIDEDRSMRSGTSFPSGRVGLCEDRSWLRIEPAPVVSPNQLPRIYHRKYDSALKWAPEWCRKSLRLVARGCHHILWERLLWSVGCGAAPCIPANVSVNHLTAQRLGAHTNSSERSQTEPQPELSPLPVLTSGRRASSRAYCASRLHSSGATCSTTNTSIGGTGGQQASILGGPA